MKHRVLIFALIVALVAPSTAGAAAPEDDFEVSGWIPYWAVSGGTKSARSNLNELSAVMPFSYTVKSDGTLNDLGKMSKSSWKRLISDAKKKDVRVTPTIMSSNGTIIHAILSDPGKRADHIHEIVRMVEKGKYDGVDIDYESKLAATRPYFSAFLNELADELDGKFLSCTIEARTPPDSLYRTVPSSIEYANDLEEIDRYCDRVNVMTYDQQRADLPLNDAAKGAPYYPVADPAWVRKVVELMARDIDKDKLVIGVASYGREVTLDVAPEWFKSYTSVRAVNPGDALATAKKQKVKASENKAGEQSYTYLAKDAGVKLRDLDVPSRPKGNDIALAALEYANETGKTVRVRVVWWSDAAAVADKVALAKDLGVRGVALFKIDGEEDEDIWDLF